MPSKESVLIHENTHHFNSILEAARIKAIADHGYDSEATRQEIASQCKDRCGYTPKKWQTDIAEALLLKLDSVLIAGTGAGKTTPFVLPLMVGQRSGLQPVLLLISPLNVLEEDQAR
jgi:ATP-dependent helicase YprA (DUF1998 family)